VAKGVVGAESFQTFCLETGVFVAQPLDLYVSEENAALGGFGSGSHAWEGGTGSGDDLDPKTAYLYQQFATGQLTEYTYSTATGAQNSYGLTRSQSAGALQRLIWNTEGEGGPLITGNDFMGIKLTQAQVDTITDWNDAYDNSGWTGIGNVRVLQTFKENGDLG